MNNFPRGFEDADDARAPRRTLERLISVVIARVLRWIRVAAQAHKRRY